VSALERLRAWRASPRGRQKQREINARYKRRHPDRVKSKRLKSLYGITLDEYYAIAAEQEGVCAICRFPSTRGRLVVDHCHRTGTVRGLLCRACNVSIGAFRESVSGLRAAADYLERWAQTPRRTSSKNDERRKLSDEQVAEIRRNGAAGWSYARIGEAFGISGTHARNIALGVQRTESRRVRA
jgi:hypothetical protein